MNQISMKDLAGGLRFVIYGLIVIVLVWSSLTLGDFVLGWIEPDPVVYLNQPFPVDGPVQRGQPIPLHAERCTTLDEPVDLQFTRALRNLHDGPMYQLTDGSAILLPGCMDSLSNTNYVPPQAEPGEYELIGIVRVQGRFREHKIVYHSAPFIVVP